MKGTMITIYADRSAGFDVKDLTAALDDEEGLALLQKGVGGYIEAVPYFLWYEHEGETHACVAFCNEDGKGKRLPYNQRANDLWTRNMMKERGCTPSPDFLVGDIIVVFGDEEFMEAL